MIQADILRAPPAHASFLFLNLRHKVPARSALRELGRLDMARLIVGLGPTFVASFGGEVPGLEPMPALLGATVSMPHTPSHLFLRISGSDPGEVLHLERAALAALSSFEVVDQVVGFMYADSRDLSGFIDGTENPTGEQAEQVAFAQGAEGVQGGAVLVVQRWHHDMDALQAMSQAHRNAAIGRDQHSNEELADAPESAHVKRTAQEDFEPQAWLLRRSMPWRDHRGAGLVFLSFSATLAPFVAQARRMVGLDDGVVDALFGFTRPQTGASYWCPPTQGGVLDLRNVAEIR